MLFPNIIASGGKCCLLFSHFNISCVAASMTTCTVEVMTIITTEIQCTLETIIIC